MTRALFMLLLFVLMTLTTSAQKPEFAPGSRYDTTIPSLRQVTGYDFGARVTPPEDIIRYLHALNQSAPERTRLIKYAESWEGRPLFALIVGNADRISHLDESKAGMQRLAAGSAGAENLIRDLPVIVALLHGVHGNEISSGEAALAEAYHLLAAQNDPVVDTIRREAIVIIDPMQNPDGRARFVFQNLLGQAMQPDSEPTAAEHDEPWPGGRTNHYLFDLNRDWFAQLHPETQGRAKLLLEWPAQVVVDLHEMGGDSTYYFPPGAEPPNPHMTKTQADWLALFGKANAARFDERGFAYFNREVFDAFYPGYGVSWPIAQGAIGMTFEMASARGLVYRRRDDTSLTYLDGAIRHFTNALTTAHTAARNREKMLRDYLEFRRTAGTGATKAYLLPPGKDQGQVQRLVRTLINNGVLVQRAAEPIRLDARTLPGGTFIVPLPQPAGMIVRNLLDPEVPMNAEFLQQQEARRKLRQPDQIYDTTAWNLPLLYDVECIAVNRALTGKTTKAELTDSDAAVSSLPDAIVGYALPWNATTAATTIAALNAGLRARFLNASFTLAGRLFATGTVFFRRADNDAELKAKLGVLAAKHGAEIVPLDSTFVEQGVSLGSNQVVSLKAPKVLLLWDVPTASLSAGWARFVLERRYGQSVTVVRVSSFGRVDLSRYEVLIMPAGNYPFSGDSLRGIRDWISQGGTLITLGEASRWATRENVALLETKTELRDGSPDSASSAVTDKAKPDAPRKVFDYDQAIQPLREQPELTPGALLRVLLDREHWLAAGTDGEIQALVESTRVFAPLRLDRGRNVGIYATKERLLASGQIWEAALAQLPQKAFLLHQPLGQGQIIAFAEDPNYRAYAEGTQFLFLNAVLLGAAY